MAFAGTHPVRSWPKADTDLDLLLSVEAPVSDPKRTVKGKRKPRVAGPIFGQSRCQSLDNKRAFFSRSNSSAVIAPLSSNDFSSFILSNRSFGLVSGERYGIFSLALCNKSSALVDTWLENAFPRGLFFVRENTLIAK